MTSSSTTNRKALHAYVSDEAHDRWHEFAAEQGVSVSAVLQGLAPILAKADLDLRDNPQGTQNIQDVLEDLVKAARKIDAVRRRRANRRK